MTVLLHASPIASMLGWFLYFTAHFKTGSLILLARGSQLEYSPILRLLTVLEKKVFKTFAVLQSPLTISSLSINFMLFVDLTLSDKKGLIVFQNVLLSLIFFSLRFPKWSDLDILRSEKQ